MAASASECGGDRAYEAELAPSSVRWVPRGAFHNTIKLGNRYREVRVELK